MWSCAGTTSLALLLAACASDADAVVTVRRDSAERVEVQLCPDVGPGCQPQTQDPLFTATEPPSTTKTIEIYLDDPVDALAVHFTIGTCTTALHLPFDGDARTPSVVLPGTLTGCSDCTLEPCP